MAQFFSRLFRRNRNRSDTTTSTTSIASVQASTPIHSVDAVNQLDVKAVNPLVVEVVNQPAVITEIRETPTIVPSLAPPLPKPPFDKRTMAKRAAEDRDYYGEDQWGISPGQRDAGMNIARLLQFGLPLFYSENDLADWLGLPLGKLRWFTHDKPADTVWHYVRYTIPKRSGGERVILAPKDQLKGLQRKILAEIIGKIPVGAAVHGFVPGRSIVTNARNHVGKAIICKMDLKDFFPSITFPRVRGFFITTGYSFSVASALALLCTEYERDSFEREGTTYYISIGPRHLAQGAPTSPALANLIAWKLDKRLTGLAKSLQFSYTRYADDLTFSGDDSMQVDKLRYVVQQIITAEHFAINPVKTRIAKQSTHQTVTGLIVNEKVSTPRKLRRQLRATLYNAHRDGLAAQNRDQRPNFYAYLSGMLAHIHNANAVQAARLRPHLLRLTAKNAD